MTAHRGLWAGFAVLAALSGCSSEDKTLNVEGAYSPVIADLSSSIEPPARGVDNLLTALVTNTRGYPLTFHWSATSGTLLDSTSQSVHWMAPDSVGVFPVTVAVEAYDDLNDQHFYTSRTFQIYVENEYVRWTKSPTTQFDVARPVLGKVYFAQIRNSSTGESDIWSVASPLGPSEQVTQSFFMATSPSAQADGSRVAFLGRKKSSDTAGSIYYLASGAVDTSAVLVSKHATSNGNLSGPRFAPTGSLLLYHSDTTSINFPRPWLRDAANLFVAPQRIVPLNLENQIAYVNGNWKGTGDSIVVQSFDGWNTVFRTSRGLFKLSTLPNSNPGPFTAWLADSGASEQDWSPNGGEFIVFTRVAPGRTDRDLYIIRAGSSDKATALQVTRGPADDSHPRFSSDGTSIFFISNRADHYGLNGAYETERRGTNIWSVSGFDLP